MRFSIQATAAILTVLSSLVFQNANAIPISGELEARDVSSSNVDLNARDVIANCRRTCGMRYDIGSTEYLDCVERCQSFAIGNPKKPGKPAKAKAHRKREELEPILEGRDVIANCRRTCGMRHDIGSTEYLDCVERCQSFAVGNPKKPGKPAKAKAHRKREELEPVLEGRDVIADCRRTCGMRHDIGSTEYLDCVERCQSFAIGNPKRPSAKHKPAAKHSKRK